MAKGFGKNSQQHAFKQFRQSGLNALKALGKTDVPGQVVVLPSEKNISVLFGIQGPAIFPFIRALQMVHDGTAKMPPTPDGCEALLNWFIEEYVTAGTMHLR